MKKFDEAIQELNNIDKINALMFHANYLQECSNKKDDKIKELKDKIEWQDKLINGTLYSLYCELGNMGPSGLEQIKRIIIILIEQGLEIGIDINFRLNPKIMHYYGADFLKASIRASNAKAAQILLSYDNITKYTDEIKVEILNVLIANAANQHVLNNLCYIYKTMIKVNYCAGDVEVIDLFNNYLI